MTMEALIARVEGLSAGDWETNCEIVCAIDRRPAWLANSKGHLWVCRSGRFAVVRFCDERMKESSGNPGVEEVPHFTTSLDAAMTLVPEGLGFMIDGYGAAWYADCSADLDAQAYAKTPALALCAAALRARTAKDTDDGE